MTLTLKSDLRSLIEDTGEPCVSLYAPMVSAGADVRQNKVRFRNLIKQAEDQLNELGIRNSHAKSLLEPVEARLMDDDYWQHQSAGLAFFRSPTLTQDYRLPIEFNDMAVVARRFHVKPLLPLLAGDGRFFILALSKNETRLYEGTRDTVSEIHVEDMPKGLAELMQVTEMQKALQWHTRTPQPGSPRPAQFHGHGAGPDAAVEKKHLLEYFRMVDRALHDVLRDSNAPLVLAGVEYLLPIYREANTYPLLAAQGIPGNPEAPRKSLEELHREAWSIVEPQFREAQQKAIQLYRQLSGTPRSSNRLSEILPAAHEGRVGVLFVEVGTQVWGTYDRDTRSVVVHRTQENGDEDLLNLSAMQAYLTGATVYGLQKQDMPDRSPIAAIMRY